MMLHIAKLISQKIDEENKKSNRENCIHVTDLSKCLTGVYWRIKGAGEALSDRQYRIFKAGHLFEEFVVNSVPSERIVELQQKFVWPELNMVGSCDMITSEEDGSLHLWEIKSQNSQAFHWNKKRGGFANPIHIEQVSLYASKLKEAGQNVSKISICYISKDDLCIQQFEVEYDQRIVDEALKKAAYLNECLKTNTPPKCVEPIVFDPLKRTKLNPNGMNVKNWMATYCPAHDVCTGKLTLEQFNAAIKSCLDNDVDYEPIWEKEAEEKLKAMK